MLLQYFQVGYFNVNLIYNLESIPSYRRGGHVRKFSQFFILHSPAARPDVHHSVIVILTTPPSLHFITSKFGSYLVGLLVAARW